MLNRNALLVVLAIGLAGCLEVDDRVGSTEQRATSTQGVRLQGVRLQGIRLQGVSLQGVRLQGIRLQGVRLQGVELGGVTLEGSELSGWEIVEGESQLVVDCVVKGKREVCEETVVTSYTATLRSIATDQYCANFDPATMTCRTELTPPTAGGLAGARIPAQLTGTDDAGNESTADVDLEITAIARDDSINTMVVDAYQSNDDVVLYEVGVRDEAGELQNLCGAPGLRGSFVHGSWGPLGDRSDEGITFACETGVIAKCMRSWGYKPWRTMTSPLTGDAVDMRELHQVCTRAARADYCGGVSHTQDGTLVDLFDSYGFNQPETSHGEVYYAEQMEYSETWHGEAIFDTDGALEIGDQGRLARTDSGGLLEIRSTDGYEFLTCSPRAVSSAEIADRTLDYGRRKHAVVGLHSLYIEYNSWYVGGH
jgi:hypothetical protein